MSALPLDDGMPNPFCTPIRIKDFDVSCVAPSPFGVGFAFGSDDGKIMFTDKAGTSTGSPSGEAINGIASIGNSIAVSSRQEVVLRTWTPENHRRHTLCVIPHGAHGVSATAGGYYVAPLGETGIMMLKASSSPGDSVGVMTAERDNMYFYRVLSQPGRDGKDLLICAARHGGIGIAEVRWEDKSYTMRTARFPELDAIDVCFVGGKPESPAIAAVGRDGSLILVRDMLHLKEPLTMKFDTIKGKAFRLLSARGHLFLLTSSALYGLMNLGKRLLDGLPERKFTTPIFMIPLDAVDASLVGDRWLPVVMPDEVLLFDLKLIEANTPENIRDGETRRALVETVEATGARIEQTWEFDDIRAGSQVLAGAS